MTLSQCYKNILLKIAILIRTLFALIDSRNDTLI